MPCFALASVVPQWLERWPVHQGVTSLIPGWGHVPGLQVQSPTRCGARASWRREGLSADGLAGLEGGTDMSLGNRRGAGVKGRSVSSGLSWLGFGVAYVKSGKYWVGSWKR